MKSVRLVAGLWAVMLASACFALPLQAQVRFDAQLRNALTGSVTSTGPSRTVPPNGASETVNPTAPTKASSTNDQPYNAGYDLEAGVVAAGGALLAAIIVILLFWLVASSRHHEQE